METFLIGEELFMNNLPKVILDTDIGDDIDDALALIMLLKMNVEFVDGYQSKDVMTKVLESCKKVEKDCEIYF